MGEVSTIAAQIGVLRLILDERHLGPLIWQPLTQSILQQATFQESDQPLISSLSHLLEDRGVGFGGSCMLKDNVLVIRCWLIPSDAPGSQWKRTMGKSSSRFSHLWKIFNELRKRWDDGTGSPLMEMTDQDILRMSELYAEIPSPESPDFSRSTSNYLKDDEMYSRLMGYEDHECVKTTSYRYQLRSLGKMIQMETEPKRLVDPLWTSFEEEGRRGTYYVNLQTWDIQRHPGWYDLPRGGILCEQMGVGKTLMCLSLIVSTLHQPCRPSPSSLDISVITTDHRLNTSPSTPYAELRFQTDHPDPPMILKKPTLAEMCADVLSISDPSAIRSPLLPPHLQPLLGKPAFYFEYPPDDSCMREAKRRTLSTKTLKKVYLANTTLIIVPSILVQQWEQEINKHLKAGTLSVYVGMKEALPPIEELVSYDVILMSVDRFGQEEGQARLKLDTGESVLMGARWKRLILDEGHVAGTKTSRAMRLAIKLNVERRWAVSGTPTRHLQQGGEIEVEVPSRTHSPIPYTPSGVNDSASSRKRNPRAWSKKDKDDATRIGIIIGGFLAAEPFKSDAAFQDRVTQHLTRPQGPSFGAVRRMRYLMSSLMVKHQPKIIDNESSLPPSTRSTEILQFHPMQRLTYNVLAALIASNVYTSNFEDADYFLHPNNMDSFIQVTRNLHLACFWFSAPAMGAEDCLVRIQHHLESNETVSEEGRIQLEEATKHLQKAIDTPGWTEWMETGVSLPFEASKETFSEKIRMAWSDSMDSNPDAIDSHSLALLRDANLRGVTEHDLSIKGWDSRAFKCQDFFKEMMRVANTVEAKNNKSKRQKNGDYRVKDKGKGKGKEHGTISGANRPSETLTAAIKRKESKSNHKLLDKSSRSKDELDENLDLAAQNAGFGIDELGKIVWDEPRPLPHQIITVSRSSKVNFVLRTILDSDMLDKFVIFGDSSELGHLTEALDLLDIKSCFAGYGHASQKRDQALREFHRPEVKVCLLDLRLAARGLNLVVANRMIFLSPVWNLDVLAQAVKRVHRIGQTKPTTVQILATEGTFEEDIAERSARSRTEDEEKLYSRAMIEKPRFVYAEKLPSDTFTINFVPHSERFMEDIVHTPPSGTNLSSPASSYIVTPSNSRVIMDSQGVQPGVGLGVGLGVGEGSGSGSEGGAAGGGILKRSGDESVEKHLKKKARVVAFA